MRIWVVSDLHLEGGEGFDPPRPDFDVLACAGDVVEGDPAAGVAAVARLASGRPAVMVLGNHDVWGLSVEEALELARAAAAGTGVHVLQDDAVTLGGVAFHGATLWTDGLLGQPLLAASDWTGGEPGTPARAFHPALPYGEPVHVRGHGMDRRAKGRDVLSWHARSVAAVEAAMDAAEGAGTPLVVLTHHAPTADSVPPGRKGLAMSASDLDHLVRSGAARAWIHGHVHLTADFVPGYGTRVACNARGGARFPNPDFDPGMVVEVGPGPVPAPRA